MANSEEEDLEEIASQRLSTSANAILKKLAKEPLLFTAAKLVSPNCNAHPKVPAQHVTREGFFCKECLQNCKTARQAVSLESVRQAILQHKDMSRLITSCKQIIVRQIRAAYKIAREQLLRAMQIQEQNSVLGIWWHWLFRLTESTTDYNKLAAGQEVGKGSYSTLRLVGRLGYLESLQANALRTFIRESRTSAILNKCKLEDAQVLLQKYGRELRQERYYEEENRACEELLELGEQSYVEESLKQLGDKLTPRVMNRLANHYHRLKRHDLANFYYSRVKEVCPDFKCINYNIGNNLFAAGNEQAAIEYFEFQLKLTPQHEKSLMTLGVICYRRKEIERAVTFFKQLVEVCPLQKSAWHYLCLCYNELGQQCNYRSSQKQYQFCK